MPAISYSIAGFYTGNMTYRELDDVGADFREVSQPWRVLCVVTTEDSPNDDSGRLKPKSVESDVNLVHLRGSNWAGG